MKMIFNLSLAFIVLVSTQLHANDSRYIRDLEERIQEIESQSWQNSEQKTLRELKELRSLLQDQNRRIEQEKYGNKAIDLLEWSARIGVQKDNYAQQQSSSRQRVREKVKKELMRESVIATYQVLESKIKEDPTTFSIKIINGEKYFCDKKMKVPCEDMDVLAYELASEYVNDLMKTIP